jgi:hypothetical protein
MSKPFIRQRRRIMDTAKKVKFAQLVRESHSLEEAAEWVDVSIRTIQRERKRDEDFDHEVRLALQASPDPLRLMENAARVHWRAAAWLLERSRPEQYGRQPVNAARDHQVQAALRMLLEAALAATAPAERAAFYQQVEPVCEQALQCCFPQLGPLGGLKRSPRLATPLADAAAREGLRADLAGYQAQAAARAEFEAELTAHLSPKTPGATVSDATDTDSDATISDATPEISLPIEPADVPLDLAPVTEPSSPLAPPLSPGGERGDPAPSGGTRGSMPAAASPKTHIAARFSAGFLRQSAESPSRPRGYTDSFPPARPARASAPSRLVEQAVDDSH